MRNLLVKLHARYLELVEHLFSRFVKRTFITDEEKRLETYVTYALGAASDCHIRKIPHDGHIELLRERS